MTGKHEQSFRDRGSRAGYGPSVQLLPSSQEPRQQRSLLFSGQWWQLSPLPKAEVIQPGSGNCSTAIRSSPPRDGDRHVRQSTQRHPRHCLQMASLLSAFTQLSSEQPRPTACSSALARIAPSGTRARRQSPVFVGSAPPGILVALLGVTWTVLSQGWQRAPYDVFKALPLPSLCRC